MVTIIGNERFYFLRTFHKKFLGHKIILVKGYHKEAKQGDKL